jgi:hypothetical protein
MRLRQDTEEQSTNLKRATGLELTSELDANHKMQTYLGLLTLNPFIEFEREGT